MTAKQSMEVFGEALLAYSRGDRSPFYLRENSGRMFKVDLGRYFRTAGQLSGMERKLISLAHGNILDVGCGTGNYLPLLADRGQVLGIDVSPKVIEVARIAGCQSCVAADIFTFSTAEKYDTITLLGNGLGIGGSVEGTRRLLRQLSKLLKDDGQVLVIARRVTQKKFVATRLCPVWKQKEGPGFRWIHIGRTLLSDLCVRVGLCLSVIQGNQHLYLLRILKN